MIFREGTFAALPFSIIISIDDLIRRSHIPTMQNILLNRPLRRLAGISCVIASGCVAPTDSTARDPEEATPGQTSTSPAPPNGASVTFPETEWWIELGDPPMEWLVRRALARNPSLEATEARVRASRHLIDVQRARLRPQLRASGGYTRAELSENLPILSDFMQQDLVETDQELFSAGFDAAWELDIFGGARSRVQGAEARANAASAGLHHARVRMVAEVARTYFQFRNLQLDTQRLDERIRLAEDLAAHVRERQRTGVGTERAVADAGARVSALRAQRPAVRAAMKASLQQLSVLSDAPTDTLRERLFPPCPPRPRPTIWSPRD